MVPLGTIWAADEKRPSVGLIPTCSGISLGGKAWEYPFLRSCPPYFTTWVGGIFPSTRWPQEFGGMRRQQGDSEFSLSYFMLPGTPKFPWGSVLCLWKRHPPPTLGRWAIPQVPWEDPKVEGQGR